MCHEKSDEKCNFIIRRWEERQKLMLKFDYDIVKYFTTFQIIYSTCTWSALENWFRYHYPHKFKSMINISFNSIFNEFFSSFFSGKKEPSRSWNLSITKIVILTECHERKYSIKINSSKNYGKWRFELSQPYTCYGPDYG